MKKLSILLLSCFALSCGKTDLVIPADYIFTKIEVESTTAYRYSNGNYEQVDQSEVGEPDISGILGNLELLELIDDANLVANDGFGANETSYTVTSDRLSFNLNGSQYSMQMEQDGARLIQRSVGGGTFDELNPFPIAYASCEDEGCDDVDPNEYIYAYEEGQIGYVIIYSEIYDRQ